MRSTRWLLGCACLSLVACASELVTHCKTTADCTTTNVCNRVSGRCELKELVYPPGSISAIGATDDELYLAQNVPLATESPLFSLRGSPKQLQLGQAFAFFLWADCETNSSWNAVSLSNGEASRLGPANSSPTAFVDGDTLFAVYLVDARDAIVSLSLETDAPLGAGIEKSGVFHVCTHPNGITGFTVDADAVFWTNHYNLWRTPRLVAPASCRGTESAGQDPLFSGSDIRHVRIHGDRLFWSDGNKVYHATVHGDGTAGYRQTLSEERAGSRVGALWTDDDGVYWTVVSDTVGNTLRHARYNRDTPEADLDTAVADASPITTNRSRVFYIAPSRAQVIGRLKDEAEATR